MRLCWGESVSILAIDPGPNESAWVEFDGERVIDHGITCNDDVRMIVALDRLRPLIVEGIACYGMPVGKETFDTCIWIGRFIEAHLGNYALVYRPAVKMHLCHSMRAKDPMVRQALIDRFGPGKEAAIGRKKTPGPLYGISSHCWSAMAVAVTYWDQNLEGRP